MKNKRNVQCKLLLINIFLILNERSKGILYDYPLIKTGFIARSCCFSYIIPSIKPPVPAFFSSRNTFCNPS